VISVISVVKKYQFIYVLSPWFATTTPFLPHCDDSLCDPVDLIAFDHFPTFGILSRFPSKIPVFSAISAVKKY
jgi:hypothetical protein